MLQQLFVYNFENLGEMHKYLEKYKLPELNKEK